MIEVRSQQYASAQIITARLSESEQVYRDNFYIRDVCYVVLLLVLHLLREKLTKVNVNWDFIVRTITIGYLKPSLHFLSLAYQKRLAVLR